MNRLTRAVLFGAIGVAGSTLSGVAAGQQANSYTESRINQFERSINDLRGRLEQLQRQNLHLQQEFDKMRSSHESRLQQLEKGTTKTPPKSRATKP